jgi:hypothetical protein
MKYLYPWWPEDPPMILSNGRCNKRLRNSLILEIYEIKPSESTTANRAFTVAG